MIDLTEFTDMIALQKKSQEIGSRSWVVIIYFDYSGYSSVSMLELIPELSLDKVLFRLVARYNFLVLDEDNFIKLSPSVMRVVIRSIDREYFWQHARCDMVEYMSRSSMEIFIEELTKLKGG